MPEMEKSTVWTITEPLAKAAPDAQGQDAVTRVLLQGGWGSPAEWAASQICRKASEAPLFLLSGGDGTLPAFSQRVFLRGGWDVRRLVSNGRCVGWRWEDDDAVYALLGGVLPSDRRAGRGEQAASTFCNLETALQEGGLAFSDVVRTWLYLDKILDWYDEFNRVRDAFFRSRNVYGGLVPASTGIGSANVWQTAIATGAIAIRAKRPDAVCCRALPSPLQCPALEYGSSFSRAVEVETKVGRAVFISGTASIEPGGKTAWVGDPVRQLDLTMDVVEAILDSRGMTFQDTTRGILYLKEAAYLPLWQAWLAKRGLKNLPIGIAEADVCRDDLLVELELDACTRPYNR